MTIEQVVNRLLTYHPPVDEDKTCDGFKCGNPADECTGIVTTCAVSIEVIRKTIKLGCNLIITHEPTFYTHMDRTDWLIGKNSVFDEKIKLLDDYGIAIWRNHDHIHAHKPDGIFYGVMKELEWESYLVDDPNRPSRFRLPTTTVRQLALFLQKKLQLNAVRIIGNVDGQVNLVAFCAHVLPFMGSEEQATQLLNEVDVIIPGELIDWTVAAYARDAGHLGMNKAILQIGHFSMEELGMKYAVNWIADIIEKEVPVHFVRSADLYNYVDSNSL